MSPAPVSEAIATRAAVLTGSPGAFEIMDVLLDPPGPGELLVRMVAAGLCRSDDHFQTGDSIAGRYPFICGHEGAGVVEAVGPGTPGWEVGDHVVFSFIPSCGRCRWCSRGMTNLCDLGRYLMLGSRFADGGGYRVHLEDGTDVGQICGLGTFAERTVVSIDSAIKLDPDLPLEEMCLLGCAVGTGWGSAVNAAEVRPGDVTIVMGAGGIGSFAIQGAAHAGALTLIAVDPVEFKRETALSLGATHAFASIGEAADFARSRTNGQGADNAILCVDVLRGEHVAAALSAIRKAGTVVVTSVAPAHDDGGIPVNPREFSHMQKRLQGSMFGMCNPRADIPMQIEMYREGRLELDSLVTRTYPLDQIVEAYADTAAGKNMRAVIRFE
ncbi:NDMA-dependent alcohol dehydrogenase [Microbacterium sp. X-17]|uniref:NDMA-dependent alcohol dehydrogenase n=1 Tax=Microbacterium sp. X-17 TaxID=3144404 RepID=UPI0031F5AF64